MSAPLPLSRVLVGAAVTLHARRGALAHAMTPIVVVQGLWALLAVAAPELATGMVLGAALLLTALYVMLAVQVHRLVLLGAGAVPRLGFGGWRLREWRYLAVYVLLWCAVAFLLLLLDPLLRLGPAGIAVSVVLAAWLAGRMAMLLPAIAVGADPDPRLAWRRGAGAGFRLAVIVVGLPACGFLLTWPLAASDLLPLELVGLLVTDLTVVWSLGALSIAWAQRAPHAGASAAEAGSQLQRAAEPGRVDVRPDAPRSLVCVEVSGPLSTPELGLLAERDGLVVYHGRLRGLVLSLDPASWDPDAEDGAGWSALDTLLSHLALVRIHHGSIGRVALHGATGWARHLEDLRKHFADAELRFFPELRRARAEAWAAHEAD